MPKHFKMIKNVKKEKKKSGEQSEHFAVVSLFKQLVSFSRDTFVQTNDTYIVTVRKNICKCLPTYSNVPVKQGNVTS